VATLEWLVGHCSDCDWSAVCLAAVKKNSRAVLDWATQRGHATLDKWHMLVALSSGDLPLVRWVHEKQRVPIEQNFACDAAYSGNRQVLDYALANGAEMTRDVMCGAVACGDEALVSYLHDERDVPWYAMMCAEAAAAGQLTMLRFLRARQCEWTSDTASEAIRNGQLETLQWSIEQGCPMAEDYADELTDALSYVDDTARLVLLLRYLHRLDSGRFRTTVMATSSVWLAAVEQGRMDVIRFLHSVTVESPPAGVLEAAVKSRSAAALEIVRYLLEEARCRIDDRMQLEASRNEIRRDVLRCLQDKQLFF